MWINTNTLAYPVREHEIRAANPSTSYPAPMPYAVDGYATVVTSPPPAFDPITQAVVEVAPVELAGVWTQQWQINALDPATAAANQAAKDQADADAAIQTTAKLDATIKYLIMHTAAQIEAKIDADVTNLATTKVILAKLAVAVGVLARRELR